MLLVRLRLRSKSDDMVVYDDTLTFGIAAPGSTADQLNAPLGGLFSLPATSLPFPPSNMPTTSVTPTQQQTTAFLFPPLSLP